ncbi:MAG: hypothetical protein R3C29_15460 [Dehalococcoidia bacterium]
MTLFRQREDGTFEVLEHTPFADLEKTLEDWIEANPGILFDGEPLAVIARQPRNTHGKYLDLLAIDRRGATVVVELKRGEAPREVLAQALEYAAWVDSLSFEQLDQLAAAYAESRELDSGGLHDLYRAAFDGDDEHGTPADPSLVTFNNQQMIVVVAESFPNEVEQTARYFRSRLGADIHLVQFGVHTAGGEIVLEASSVVGREAVRPPAPPKNEGANDDAVRGYVKSDWMRSIVGFLDRWAADRGDPVLVVEHPNWNRRIRYRGVELAYYYHAQRWISLQLTGATQEEIARLRSGLTQPEHIKERDAGTWCRLYADQDVDLLERILVERIEELKGKAAT